jgi:hypothetical protein
MHTGRILINFDDLEAAFEDASGAVRYYLDLETGAVIAITDEVRDELHAIDKACQDALGAADDIFAAALQQRELPEWMRAMVHEAHAIEQGYGSRYVAIPTADSRADYCAMEDFIETVSDPRLHARLLHAIQGRGAFRRFKDVLLAHPHERERWFTFSAARVHERVLAWLHDEAITAILKEE